MLAQEHSIDFCRGWFECGHDFWHPVFFDKVSERRHGLWLVGALQGQPLPYRGLNRSGQGYGRLFLHRHAVSRLSTETARYARSLSQALCALAGTGPGGGPGPGAHTSLCPLTTRPRQDRSPVLRTQTAPGPVPRAAATPVERGRAVLLSRDSPESQTAGAVPRPTAATACPESRLRSRDGRRRLQTAR